MRAEGRKHRSRGISLVEMLVALAVLGLLATLSLGGVRLGVRTWETVDLRVDTESRERIVRSFLQRTLAQALPVMDPTTGTVLFEGNEDTLSLVAPIGDHIGLGGAQRIRLVVEEIDDSDREGQRLVMYRAIYDSGVNETANAFDWANAESHVLMENFSEAVFSYMRPTETGAREWVGRWNGEFPLPRLVRLSVTAQPGARPWPDIVALLRVDTGGRRR